MCSAANAILELELTSNSNLNHRRYAVNDETLYVAPSDKRTDYSQPPMSSFYYGVLNTGRRRYAHPALTGSLPQPWLPAKDKAPTFGDGAAERRGVVLSLRRKMAKRLKRQQSGDGIRLGDEDEVDARDLPDGWAVGNSMDVETGDEQRGAVSRSPSRDRHQAPSGPNNGGAGQSGSGSSLWGSANPWSSDSAPARSASSDGGRNRRQVAFDPISGTIALPEGNVWGDEEDDDEGDEAEDGEGGNDEAESPVSTATLAMGRGHIGAPADPCFSQPTSTIPSVGVRATRPGSGRIWG